MKCAARRPAPSPARHPPRRDPPRARGAKLIGRPDPTPPRKTPTSPSASPSPPNPALDFTMGPYIACGHFQNQIVQPSREGLMPPPRAPGHLFDALVGDANGWRGRLRFLHLVFALGLLVAPLPAAAQQPAKGPRLGFLGGSAPAAPAHSLEAFRQGLREL